MRGPDALALELLGIPEQMRTVLKLAADGKVRTVMDRFHGEGDDVCELLAAGKLRSRAVLENVRT
jgi:propanol-preferring alcohol dehydrogenase